MKQRTLLFIFVLLSTLTASAYDAKIDGIFYNFNNWTREAIVTHGNTKYTGSVTIPETVIYNNASYSVTSIENSAFSNCIGLKSVTIPSSVKSIGRGAFNFCSGLTSVTIPNSVTEIENDTFNSCYRLTSVTIPNNVTSIGDYAFCACSSLTSVAIPNSVKSIGNYAFHGCTGLTEVIIPGRVAGIGQNAFSECYGLKSVTIPLSMLSIGKWAFQYCTNLHDVYCYAESLPITNEEPFLGVPVSSATLHVPAASLEKYKAKSPWRSFGTIIVLTDEEMPVKGINSEEVVIEKAYDLIGRQLRQSRKGVNILRYGNGKTRKVMVK